MRKAASALQPGGLSGEVVHRAVEGLGDKRQTIPAHRVHGSLAVPMNWPKDGWQLRQEKSGSPSCENRRAFWAHVEKVSCRPYNDQQNKDDSSQAARSAGPRQGTI